MVEADENLGFSGGNNLGAQHASGEFLCFLNPDVIVGPGWLEPLIAALDDPVVGIAAPVLVDPDGTLQEAGQLVYDDGCTAAVGGPEVMPGDWSNAFSRDVDYASAACWVVRREEFLALGGFDERYRPAYFEDVDYAMRVEQAGRRTRLVVDVPVVHEHASGGSGEAVAIAERSRDTFRSTWASELASRPTRPDDQWTAIDNRDRLAGRRSLTIARYADCGRRRWEQALDDAAADAARRPRDRVTLLTDREPTPERADAARRSGLEVVVVPSTADPGAQRRIDEADDVRRIRSPRRFLRPTIVVAVVAALVVGLLVRWLVLRSPAGILTADEAYTGIQSFEILGGQFPVVLGGTTYTLPLESYLYAPIAAVVGANVVLLKLLATLSWALASAALGFAAHAPGQPHEPRLIAALLCWFTPGALLLVSVSAYAGLRLRDVGQRRRLHRCDGAHRRPATPTRHGRAVRRARRVRVLVASDVPGVAAPDGRRRALGPSTPHRRLGHRHTRRTARMPAVPAWNAVNAWPSLSAPAEVEGTYTERFRGFFVDLLPRAFGLRDLALDWQPDDVIGPLLYVALIALVIFGRRRTGAPARPPQPRAAPRRPRRRLPDHGAVREPHLRQRRPLRDHRLPVPPARHGHRRRRTHRAPLGRPRPRRCRGRRARVDRSD